MRNKLKPADFTHHFKSRRHDFLMSTYQEGGLFVKFTEEIQELYVTTVFEGDHTVYVCSSLQEACDIVNRGEANGT